MFDGFFGTKSTEQQRELRKREKWLRTSRRNEKIAAFFSDLVDGVINFGHKSVKFLVNATRKKSSEEKEIIKRERWLNNARKKEAWVNKMNAKKAKFSISNLQVNIETFRKNSVKLISNVYDNNKCHNNENYIKNLRISKIVTGTLIATGSVFTLASRSLPTLSIGEVYLLSAALNFGFLNMADGIFNDKVNEDNKVKVKVFKDLDKIGK